MRKILCLVLLAALAGCVVAPYGGGYGHPYFGGHGYGYQYHPHGFYR